MKIAALVFLLGVSALDVVTAGPGTDFRCFHCPDGPDPSLEVPVTWCKPGPGVTCDKAPNCYRNGAYDKTVPSWEFLNSFRDNWYALVQAGCTACEFFHNDKGKSRKCLKDSDPKPTEKCTGTPGVDLKCICKEVLCNADQNKAGYKTTTPTEPPPTPPTP